MARMIPGDPPDPNRGGGKAEAAVFHPQSADAGEIDFLAVHRTGGLLFIEVKGRSVERKRDGNWYRGDEIIRSPLGQVIRHAHEFTECLRDGWRRIGNGTPLPLVFGYALAFPLTSRDMIKDSPELPLEMVITSEDVPTIGDFVVNAMASWGESKGSGLGPPLGEAAAGRSLSIRFLKMRPSTTGRSPVGQLAAYGLRAAAMEFEAAVHLPATAWREDPASETEGEFHEVHGEGILSKGEFEVISDLAQLQRGQRV